MDLKDRKAIKNGLPLFELGGEGYGSPQYGIAGMVIGSDLILKNILASTQYTKNPISPQHTFTHADRMYVLNNPSIQSQSSTDFKTVQNTDLYKLNSLNPIYNPQSSSRMGQYDIKTDTFEGGEGTNLNDLVVKSSHRFRMPSNIPEIKINTQPNSVLPDAGAGGVTHRTPHGTEKMPKGEGMSKADKIAGNAMNIMQGVMGSIQLANQWSEGSKARINPEEMLMKYGTSNTSIGGGFSYERQNNIDAASEMDQVKAETNQAALGMAMTGMSTGGAIGSVLGPVGGAVGAVAGGLIGGIGGLLSGSSRRKKEEERLRKAHMLANARTNQNRSVAFTEQIRKEIANKYGNQEDQLLYAAKGKDAVDPITNLTYKNFVVDTAFGKLYMPQNAWGSKGEWIESGSTGDLHKITHGKNDTARIHVDDNDTIYSAKLLNPITGNKIANDVPAYAAAGKLDELKMIQRNQRYNKASLRRLPGFARGAEWLSNAIPALTGFGIGLLQYNLAANQDVYKPNSFKPNEYKGTLNELDKLHIDYLPIANEQRAAEARNVRTLFNSGGLSVGLRATNLIGANLNTQNAIANGLMNWQKWNNELRSAAAQARLNVGAQEAQRKQQAEQWDANVYAKGHAARLQGTQMGLYNMQNALEQYVANEFKRNQFNRSMNLYEQELENDRRKNAPDTRTTTSDFTHPLNNSITGIQNNQISKLNSALESGLLKGTVADPDVVPYVPSLVDQNFGMDDIKPLKLGSSGDRVKILQERLNTLNKGNKTWTPLNSGIYDKATKNAVLLFQKENFPGRKNRRLWDGIYGKNTRSALLQALRGFTFNNSDLQKLRGGI